MKKQQNMEAFMITRQSMRVSEDQIHVLFLWLLLVEDTCSIVAVEIPCVDDIALNAPKDASVAKKKTTRNRCRYTIKDSPKLLL
jgi:hypothetical protein